MKREYGSPDYMITYYMCTIITYLHMTSQKFGRLVKFYALDTARLPDLLEAYLTSQVFSLHVKKIILH